jgi:transcriptional regulator GlxA family with amidase domain
VAAICGATVALASAGFLNNRPHTSNDLDYLKATCPAYQGEAHYRHEPAVTDGDLITATGVAPLEFAYHILKQLDVCTADTLDAWYKLYVTHEPRYFFQLMQSLPQRMSA